MEKEEDEQEEEAVAATVAVLVCALEMIGPTELLQPHLALWPPQGERKRWRRGRGGEEGE